MRVARMGLRDPFLPGKIDHLMVGDKIEQRFELFLSELKSPFLVMLLLVIATSYL